MIDIIGKVYTHELSRQMKSLFFFIFNLSHALLAQASGLGEVGREGLTGEQAKQVLILVLKHERFQLAKKGMDIDGPFKVDPSIPYQRGFWDFGLTYDSPKYGATKVLGQYAVSRLTGDFWEINLCKRFDFLALRRMQAQIMSQTGKSRADEVEARVGLYRRVEWKVFFHILWTLWTPDA